MQETQLVQEDQLGFSQVEKLLHKLTWSGMTRLAKINHIQPYEDMFQEVFIVYMQAKKSFDASRNFRFSTYLQTCVQNFFSDFIKRSFGYATRTDALDDIPAFEAIDTAMTPEQAYVAKCNIEIANAELSGLSRVVLIALLYPSEQMRAAHEDHMRNGGNHAMDIKFVTRFVVKNHNADKHYTEEQLQVLTKKVCHEFRKVTKKLTAH